jgi:hypothetical protein
LFAIKNNFFLLLFSVIAANNPRKCIVQLKFQSQNHLVLVINTNSNEAIKQISHAVIETTFTDIINLNF